MTLPRLHPLSEVASTYSIPLRSLMERACRREFDHIRIGKRRYLTDDQLTAFLAAHTVTTPRDDALAATRERQRRRRRRAAAARAA